MVSNAFFLYYMRIRIQEVFHNVDPGSGSTSLAIARYCILNEYSLLLLKDNVTIDNVSYSDFFSLKVQDFTIYVSRQLKYCNYLFLFNFFIH